jgi:hypothetical protein
MYITESASLITTSQLKGDRTPILLDPMLIKYLSLGIRCKVRLVSEELELDANEMAVPKSWKTIELIVLEDSRETIEQIVASIPEYAGYRVDDYWYKFETDPF